MSDKKRPKSQTSENFDRRCVNLWIGDWEWLQTVHSGNLGAGVVVRELVRKYRKRVEEKANARMPSIAELEIKPEDVIL